MVGDPDSTEKIERCPVTGVLLLPDAANEFTVGMTSWPTTAPAREFVTGKVAAVIAGRHAIRQAGRDEWRIDFTSVLAPQPDNTFNPQAVAVVLPRPTPAGLDLRRHIGWFPDRQVDWIQPLITTLMKLSGEPIGCRCYIRLSTFDREEHDSDLLPTATARGFGYAVQSIRIDVAPQRRIRAALAAFAAAHVHDRIVPIVTRNTYWARSDWPWLQTLLPAGIPVDVELRVEGEQLNAHYDGHHVGWLHPDERQYFARTYQRVAQLGGTALARAVPRRGSLAVWIEDERPPAPESGTG